MKESMLTENKMPFCPGCGHGVVVNNISKALIELGYHPLDVILVSDIGCSGLVDPLFQTHTIHGLHGRSPAMGLGVAMGLVNQNKKVVVIQGDGGATIGLQHLMEAARRNIDITLLVFNNLLYGMTGGQISGLSTDKFKEFRHFEEGVPPFDIVRLAHQAGATSSARVISPKKFNEKIKNAIQTKGFSLLELASVCPSYGVKKIKEIKDYSAQECSYTNKRKQSHINYLNTTSLFENLDSTNTLFESNIDDKMGFVLAGSAGGGIQSAAKLLAKAGMMSGLYVSMKGEYPVTVGTGFSVAEVILSRNPINYTGLETPDVMIAVSADGLNKVREKAKKQTQIYIDNKLEMSTENCIQGSFVKNGGKKGAVLHALSCWFDENDYLDSRAFFKAIETHKYAEKLLATLSGVQVS